MVLLVCPEDTTIGKMERPHPDLKHMCHKCGYGSCLVPTTQMLLTSLIAARFSIFLNILDDLPRDANELASESSSYDWYVLSHLKRKSVGDHHVDHHVRSNSQKIQKMGDMCKSRSTKSLQEVAPARFKWIYNLHNCNNIILQRSYSTK